MKIMITGIHISLEPREAVILSAVLSSILEDDPYSDAAGETGLDINTITSFMHVFKKELADKI